MHQDWQKPAPTAIAIAAHPDDIEFLMAGTLLLLKGRGWDIHYFNLSRGNLGSATMGAEETAAARLAEAKDAAELLGAEFHPPIAGDLEILYTTELLRKVAAAVRVAKPSIVLTHSLEDYMEDHMNTARLAVTGAFSRGMPNFETDPAQETWEGDTAVYHAVPHGLCDGMRRLIAPGAYVDTAGVLAAKREALAAHRSQKEWLDVSQGMDSYLDSMESMSAGIGLMSGVLQHAEGWRRHSHLGFSQADHDPLAEALGDLYHLNYDYEGSL
jgi:LmbE family N-acetylglucosaminyl deacetylase